MKRFVLIVCLLGGIIGSVSAQRDDLYFVPKKKNKVVNVDANKDADGVTSASAKESAKTLTVTEVSASELLMDEDAYNRRGSYLTEQGSAVSELAMNDEGFVLITEEGDTLWMDTDTLRLARVSEGEGWINGFDGSDSDYEYAMRIVRFRNPRYAIPASSPLYWDVVYGGALWPSWDWNVYDDGMYAYVFPTSSNWYYWDYMMSYPFGWSYPYGHHWGYYSGFHYGYHYGYHYGHVWYDPWHNPYFHGYNPGWYHGPHHGPHFGHYPHYAGKPGWSGPKAHVNHRTPGAASERNSAQLGRVEGRAAAGSSRTSVSSNRTSGNSSVRVVTGSSNRPSNSSVRSSGGNRVNNEEVVRRSTGSSSVGRSSLSSSSSRSSYTSRTSSSNRSSSSYSRSSSTSSSSSSSSVSRSSSSSSSYSSGSSSRSSYSGGSNSYSSGGSSYSSGGGSYGGGSRSGGSYSGGGSSRSSGSRR